MKFLGLVLILVSSGMIGFFVGDKYLSVLKEIKRTDRLLSKIILGLQSERLTVSEIFENAAETEDLCVNIFLKNLSVANLNTATKVAKESGFCTDKKTLAILSAAFGILGRYSASQQITELNICRSKLNSLYEKSEEALLAKAKLSRYSGILAGIFIFIVLI